MDTHKTQSFGRYTLIERMALGGMAEIYRAKTLGAAGFEKEVVLKRILPQFSADQEFVQMFIEEARVASKLQHANIVQIFDFDRARLGGERDESYYLAMELVEGRDLRSLFKEGVRVGKPLPVEQALFCVAEALRGLHYAHTRQESGTPLAIVHRDVSPHNILVSYAGEVKISDFGIAKAAARASITSNGMVRGKLTYMSPEQVTGQPLDLRSDVYSMGVVLWELLTAKRMFQGLDEEKIVERVRSAKVEPPSRARPGLSPEMDRVVAKMVARKPADRFASAGDAAAAITQLPEYRSDALSLGEHVRLLFPQAQRRGTLLPNASLTEPQPKDRPMSDPRDRKTQAASPVADAKTLREGEGAREAEDARRRAQDPAGSQRVAGGGPPPPAQPGDNAGQSTMMLDANNSPLSAPMPSPGSRQAATIMSDKPLAQYPVTPPQHAAPSAGFAPPPRRPSTAGRWIAGPIISLIIAIATAGVAHVALKPKVKPTGRVRIGSEPAGASVSINGQRHAHVTPTMVDGEIGSTVRVALSLEGYEPKDETVYVNAGEHTINFKLKSTAPVAPSPEPSPSPSVAPIVEKKSRHSSGSSGSSTPQIAPVKEPLPKGSISVFVRPWAIVFVDGTRLRQTPIDKVELSAGKHTVELVNDSKGRREKIPVTVEEGKHQELRFDWDK